MGGFLAKRTLIIKKRSRIGSCQLCGYLVGGCVIVCATKASAHQDGWDEVGGIRSRCLLARMPDRPDAALFVDMTLTREERIRAVLEKRQHDLHVLLENVDDPHNLGAILRSCDAMGVGKVHLLYTNGRPPRMKELKTNAAASAAKWLEIQQWSSVAACVAAMRAPIYVATLALDGLAPWDCDLRSPCVLAVGNEHDGPSEALVAAASKIITIPMQGFVESLNVSVATAICLADALRQRLAVRN